MSAVSWIPNLEWMSANLRETLAPPLLQAALALAAVACGAIIGTEREKQQKPAGLRTLILVCLGSAIFTMVSFAFSTSTGDSGRVAAQIVTGVGFLGAGAILHSRNGVTGMTTAASVWVMAAIGITVGAGYPLGGLAACALVRTVLASIGGWEARRLGGKKSATVEMLLNADHGKTRIRLERIRQAHNLDATLTEQERLPNGDVRVRIQLNTTRAQFYELLAEVADMPAVKQMRELP